MNDVEKTIVSWLKPHFATARELDKPDMNAARRCFLVTRLFRTIQREAGRIAGAETKSGKQTNAVAFIGYEGDDYVSDADMFGGEGVERKMSFRRYEEWAEAVVLGEMTPEDQRKFASLSAVDMVERLGEHILTCIDNQMPFIKRSKGAGKGFVAVETRKGINERFQRLNKHGVSVDKAPSNVRTRRRKVNWGHGQDAVSDAPAPAAPTPAFDPMDLF